MDLSKEEKEAVLNIFNAMVPDGKLEVRVFRSSMNEDMKQVDFIPVHREATDEEAEEMTPDNRPWSEDEKKIMTQMCDPEPRIEGEGVRLMRVTADNGHEVNLYEMPDELRKEHIRRLWPFDPLPADDDVLYDIHSDQRQRFDECQIIRWHGYNFVVCKRYLNAGGMAVDLQDTDDIKSVLCVQNIKKEIEE